MVKYLSIQLPQGYVNAYLHSDGLAKHLTIHVVLYVEQREVRVEIPVLLHAPTLAGIHALTPATPATPATRARFPASLSVHESHTFSIFFFQCWRAQDDHLKILQYP